MNCRTTGGTVRRYRAAGAPERSAEKEKNMRYQRIPLLATALVTLSIATVLASPPKVGIDFKRLLPVGWIVVSVDTTSSPYGWANDPKNPGLSVHLEGPTEIENRGPQHEGVTLCFMPPEYVPGKMQDVQLTGSAFLGKADKFQLFIHVWPGTPTWTTCREDISKYFGVMMPNKVSEATSEPAPGAAFSAPQG